MARRHHALREPRESCVPHRDVGSPRPPMGMGRLHREEGSRGDTPCQSDSIIIMPHFFNMNTRVSMARSRDRARLLHSILVVRGRLVELPGAG